MKLYQRFTVKAQAGTISDEGIRQINLLIARQNLTDGDWQLANQGTDRRFLPALPENFLWVWQGEADGYRGTFPKRVAQFYFKNYQVKLPWTFMSELGNIARQHSAFDLTYEFEFVNRINWEAGEFGDSGSCYWGSNEGALEMLEGNGALAVRFYDEDGDGIARAWVVEIDGDVLIIFNGYGFAGDPTRVIARVIAEFVNGTYRQIRLTNDSTASGVLWINGASGYAVGPADEVAAIDHYDFGWDEPYYCECSECGRQLNEDEIYYGPGDTRFCERCYDQVCAVCDRCNIVHWSEDMEAVDDEFLCPRCAEVVEPPAPPKKKGKQ